VIITQKQVLPLLSDPVLHPDPSADGEASTGEQTG